MQEMHTTLHTPPQGVLVLQVQSTTRPLVRPAFVPAEARAFLTDQQGCRLTAWLRPDVPLSPLLGILRSLLVDQQPLLTLQTLPELLHLRLRQGTTPTLLLSTTSFLAEGALTPLPTAPDLFRGSISLAGSMSPEEGYTSKPDSYLRAWWTSLQDEEGDLLAALSSIWYAAVMQAVEHALGWTRAGDPPERIAPVQAHQQRILAAAPAAALLWRPAVFAHILTAHPHRK